MANCTHRETSAEASRQNKNKLAREKRRLIMRIAKEFEKKFFIGDIAISDREYELLLDDSKKIAALIVRSGRAFPESTTLAVALVQIGIRKYDGKYFWPYVERELGLGRNVKCQQLLGETFINTLRKYGKYVTDVSERVQNILFHGFVSNYYANALFELLFHYYTKVLERDIYRNTTEQMQMLMETLARKATLDEKESEAFTAQFMAKGSRAYKLRSHTLQAISAHPVHSRTRLRRILRLIDGAFWKNTLPKHPISRLTILFKEWVEESDAFKKEYKLYQLGEIRNRGKKHFSTPYLYANIASGKFELRMPAQIVAEEYKNNLVWQIVTCARTVRMDADSYPVLTGYKTEELRTAISQEELFGDIQCQLIQNNSTVRRFPYFHASSVRFFDMEGDYAPRLFKIPMCAYAKRECTLHSGALISRVPHGEIIRWDFEFQQGDLVVLSDGTGMIVGDHYADGLIPRGRVQCAQYRLQENKAPLPVYAAAPALLLTIPKEKLSGTIIYCNDMRYRLTDCLYTEFENKDARGTQAVSVPLEQFDFCKTDGIKTVILDVPGAYYDKSYSFVLIEDLFVDFPGAPYVFEERGVVLFPEHVRVDGDYEKLAGENGYRFALSGSDDCLHLTVNDSIPLEIQIPALAWSSDNENWRILPAGELWHTEFFNIRKLYLRSPARKISVFTNSDIDDEDDDNHVLFAEGGSDGLYTIDMTRFRSWLTRKIMKNDIILKLAGKEYLFATVYTKSLVVSYDVNADYDNGVLTWLSDIIGKADYYLDIVHIESGTILAEKKRIVDGKLVLKDMLRSGLYKFTLYEADEDDSGFDEPIYEELLSTQQQLINRNDASGQFLRIRSFKPARNSNLYTPFKKKYHIADFEKVDRDLYKGKLVADGVDTGMNVTVEFLKQGDLRFFHVTAWHEEEECDVDLLYDREQGTLELDQLPGLRSSESYRRYIELSYGDFVYYGFLQDKAPEASSCIAEPSTVMRVPEVICDTSKYTIPIKRLKLSAKCYAVLTQAGLRSVGDLVRLSGEQWLQLRDIDAKGFAEISLAVNKVGLSIKSPYYQNRGKQ